VARILGQRLSVSMGQQFVIENKAGAGSTIGTDFVAKAAPDGYTLVMISTTHVISPWIYKSMPYDPIKGFVPVTKLVDSPYVLLVNPKVPARNVQEFIALAKSKPGSITFASAGNGSMSHLNAETLKTITGIDLVHVPYKGGGAAAPDLISGQVQMMIETGASAVIYGGMEARGVAFEGVAAALSVPGADLRLFGKPEAFERRRLGVALARAEDVETARERALEAASRVRVVRA
jgi:tripartite-type tricarboxylate transporter receptor subunit TctC